MNDISIIIPIYKGEKYISYWLQILEKNVEKLHSLQKVDCEVIFVNDSPTTILSIDNVENNSFCVKVINNSKNLGIHATRVIGLDNAIGAYVVMLDQDDKITSDYLVKQYSHIEDNDMIICNGYIERSYMKIKRKIFTNIEMQKKVLCYERMLCDRNYIVSPGQVMIRKAAIPTEWTSHIMKKNGVDDYFLWILMLRDKKRIAFNFDFLYSHIEYGDNFSGNETQMRESLEELIQIFYTENILPLSDIEKIKEWTSDPLKPNGRLLEIIKAYDKWMYLDRQNVKVEEYFLANNYKKIIIYGMSYLGNRLMEELEGGFVKVVAGIDRCGEEMCCELPIVTLENEELQQYLEDADVVVVTAIFDYESIKTAIQNKNNIMVVSFKDILASLL